MKEAKLRRVIAAVAMAHPCTFPKGFVQDDDHKINDYVAPEDIRPDVVAKVEAALRRHWWNSQP